MTATIRLSPGVYRDDLGRALYEQQWRPPRMQWDALCARYPLAAERWRELAACPSIRIGASVRAKDVRGPSHDSGVTKARLQP